MEIQIYMEASIWSRAGEVRCGLRQMRRRAGGSLFTRDTQSYPPSTSRAWDSVACWLLRRPAALAVHNQLLRTRVDGDPGAVECFSRLGGGVCLRFPAGCGGLTRAPLA